MSTIANLMVMIGGDIKGLSNSMKQAQGQLKSFNSSAKTAGTALSVGVTLPILGMGAAMLKVGMDFEQGMSNIKAVSNASANEMKQLHDLALKMGADTKFSALEAANGIEELMKAGVSTTNILNGGLDGALALAAAGGIDLASAAEIASTALNAFKKDNLTVMQAADLLAGAANASATDVGELKFALGQVSSVASGIGLSFKDTTVALAEFAQNGLKGSDAGTSLKTMLMNLVPQTKQQITLFGKLGLLTKSGTSAFFDQTGKLKNLKDISDTLRKSMAGMTEETRFATMQTLFGSDAIRAANILYKEGADGVDNMNMAMSNVTASETAKIKMDNLKGSIENLKGSVETAMVKLYEMNDGALKVLVDELIVLVNAFTNLSPQIQSFILIAAGVVAAIGPILFFIGGIGDGLAVLGGLFSPVIAGFTAIAAWIGTAVEAIGLWIGGAGTFGEAMLLISGPVGWIIAAVIALVAAFTLLWMYSDGFRAGMIAIWEGLKVAAGVAFNAILFVITWAFGIIKDFWAKWGGDITSFFSSLWNGIVNVSTIVFSAISQFITFIFSEIQAFWDQWGGTITQAFTNIFEILKILIETALNITMTVIKTIFQGIKVFWDIWGALITAVFKTLFDVLKVLFMTAWDAIKLIVGTAIGIVAGIIKLALDLIKGNWSGAWDDIKGILSTVWDFIKGGAKIFADAFTGIFNALKSNVVSIFDGIWTGISGTINKITGAINSLINTINSIPMVNIPNIPSIPTGGTTGKVVKHAAGGVFTKPTMLGNHLFGENGDEAIVPLSKYGGFGGGSQLQPIVVYLDGQKIYEGMDRQLGNRVLGLGGV